MEHLSKINAEPRDLWAEALESGEYQQGTRWLRTPDGGYCCLGVACEVYIKAGHTDLERYGAYGYKAEGSEYVDESSLPTIVSDWLGVRNEDPVLAVVNEFDAKTAAELNDEADWTFEQIAAAIRALPTNP